MEKPTISKKEALRTIEEIRRDIDPSSQKKWWYRHLIIYILVIGFLWFLNLRSTMDPSSHSVTLWAIYPTLGWGIALIFHFFRTKF